MNQERKINMDKKELIADGVGDVPVWLADEGLEFAIAYFENNGLNPYACYEAMLKKSNTVLKTHWDKAEQAANRVLLSNPQYDNSMICLSIAEE